MDLSIKLENVNSEILPPVMSVNGNSELHVNSREPVKDQLDHKATSYRFTSPETCVHRADCSEVKNELNYNLIQPDLDTAGFDRGVLIKNGVVADDDNSVSLDSVNVGKTDFYNIDNHAVDNHRNLLLVNDRSCGQGDVPPILISRDVQNGSLNHANQFLSKTVRPQSYSCSYCDRRFKWKKHLELHVEFQHPVLENVHRCTACSKLFTSNASLTRHKVIKHAELQSLHACVNCPAWFISRGHYNRHKISCSENSDVFANCSETYNDDAETSDYDIDFDAYKCKDSSDEKKPLSKLCIKMSRKIKINDKDGGDDSSVGSVEFSISKNKHRKRYKIKGIDNRKKRRTLLTSDESEEDYHSLRKKKGVQKQKTVTAEVKRPRGRPRKNVESYKGIKRDTSSEKGRDATFMEKDPGLKVVVNCDKDRNYQQWAENELARWRKFKVETILAKFSCILCAKDFSRRNHMKRHLSTVHCLGGDDLDSSLIDSTKYNCPGCHELFPNRAALKHHMCNTCTIVGDTDVTSSYIECKHCKQNVEKYRIKRHLEGCGKFYECVYCDIIFNTHKEYNQHRLSVHEDKTTFPCRFCGMIFKKFYQMNRHMNVHLKVKPISCSECKLKFTREKVWKEHMVTEHEYQEEDLKGMSFGYVPLKSRHYEREVTLVKNEQKDKLDESNADDVEGDNYSDDNSKVSNNDKLDLKAVDGEDEMLFKKLLKESHISEKRKYPCPTCGKVLSQKSHLSRHMTVHGAKKNHLCQECGKRFATKYHLSRHMISHSGVREHQCTHCGKLFMKKESLNSHMVIHSDRDKFTCFYCSKSYFEKKTLDAHVDKRHVNPSPAKRMPCEICGEEFADRICLKKHKNRMHNDDLLQCKECLKQYVNKAALKSHIIKDHGSSSAVFQCITCQKIFLTQRDYSRHLTTHTEVRQHECPECGRMFKRQSHVLAHMTMHSGEKPHQCPHCSKLFRRTDYLYGHLKRDHGELNPHKCHLCSFSCDHINRLKKHLAQTHDITYENRCSLCSATFSSRERLTEHLFKGHEATRIEVTSNQRSNKTVPTSHTEAISEDRNANLCRTDSQNFNCVSNSQVHQALTPSQILSTPSLTTVNDVATSKLTRHPSQSHPSNYIPNSSPAHPRPQPMNPHPAHNHLAAPNAMRHIAPVLPPSLSFNQSQVWPPYPHSHIYHNV